MNLINTVFIYTYITIFDVNAKTKLENSITNAGKDFVTILKTTAAVITLAITSIVGVILLILCIVTGWKSRNGNSDAWGDAMQQIATLGAIVCFSAAINTAFF